MSAPYQYNGGTGGQQWWQGLFGGGFPNVPWLPQQPGQTPPGQTPPQEPAEPPPPPDFTPYVDQFFGGPILAFTVPYNANRPRTSYYYRVPGDDSTLGPPPGQEDFERFLMTLPYDSEGVNLVRSAYDQLVLDYLSRIDLLGQELSKIGETVQSAMQKGLVLPTWSAYLARLDTDALLYALSPASYYRNKVAGATGLTPEERNILAQQAGLIAQEFGKNAQLDRELAERLDPRYALAMYGARSGLTTEEQQRLAQLYPTLLTRAPQLLGGMAQWLSGQPARQLLLEYDPEFALNQYLAGQQLSREQQQALRGAFDAMLTDWRAQGAPGSFYSWLQGQSSAADLAEAYDPQLAFGSWLGRQTGLTSEAQTRINRSFDRLYGQYQKQPTKGTFRDFLKQLSPGEVALGQAPADLSGLVGRTRWLGF